MRSANCIRSTGLPRLVILLTLMSQRERAATPSVCFCSMWERTESWVAIGEQLAARGLRVFHIVTPSEYRDLCSARGVPADQILWLRIDEALAQPLDTDAVRRIAEYER